MPEDKPYFPLAEGIYSQPELSKRDLKERKKAVKKLKKTPPSTTTETKPAFDDSDADASDAELPTDMPTASRDFWVCTEEYIERHHVRPRAKLYVPQANTLSHYNTSTSCEKHVPV